MYKKILIDKDLFKEISLLEEKDACLIVDALAAVNLNEKIINKEYFLKSLDLIKKFFSQELNNKIKNLFLQGTAKEITISDFQAQDNNYVKIKNFEKKESKKISVNTFIKYFRNRYEKIKKTLEGFGLENLSSIRGIGEEQESHIIIGMVFEKLITKNKNIVLVIEDLTGRTNIIINKQNTEVFEKAQKIAYDEVLAFCVTGNNDALFCKDIIFPEIKIEKQKNADSDSWAVFISDLHCGSKMFLENNFLNFIKWINGESGDSLQKEISKKVKYLFVAGDLVDGISHYPGHENFLSIKTSIEQYKKVKELFCLIRKDVKIIICAGNHDAVWVGEPQPILSKKYLELFSGMDNVTFVTNPSLIEVIGGYKVYMYHGAGINRFISEIPELRTKFGYKHPTKIVEEMLRVGHVCPMHGVADYIPGEEDFLVIEEAPDIFVTGDIHKSEIGLKNNILLLACSCWQSITPFMQKRGIIPDYCKVPIFNFKTKDLKILDFEDLNSGIKTIKELNISSIGEKENEER